MVNVQIDMWRFGDEKDLHEIGNLKIANMHTNRKTQDALYRCTLYDENDMDYTEVKVQHNRKEGIYILLEKIFHEINKNRLR